MTPLPDPNFQTGGQFTAGNANGIVEAILAKLQPISFDFTNQTGNPTLLTYDVPVDTDQIIIINVYLDNAVVQTDGSYASLIWTDMEGTVQEPFTIANNPNPGGIVMFARTFKAKRATQVIITATGGIGDVFACGGSLVVVKSVS